MDVFKEYIVNKKREPVDNLIAAGLIVAAIVVTYILLQVMFLSIQFMAGIGLLLIVGCWFFAIKAIKNRNIEYEYILTNHELDIDKIMARSTRKRLTTVDLHKIESLGSVKDVDLENSGRKIKNYAGDISGERVYYIDMFEEAEAVRIVFQPSGSMLEAMKMINPRKVSVKDEDL